MSHAPPRAATALPPRAAAGIEVLGPMAGSGYRTPPVLVRRGDGQMVQLTPLLATVLTVVDGHRDLEEIADHAGAELDRSLHPDDVAQLLAERLAPLGLVELGEGPAATVRRADPLLGLRGRIQLAGPERTAALARPFQWLFRPPVVAAVLAAFTAFSTWVVLRHGLGTAIDEAIADPMLLLGVIALVLASGAFHELGHAAACSYGGARPRAMGAAVYLVWPAFYTDVTESYRLDRRGRLRVDLGGLYFNAVFTVATGAAWALTGTEALLVLVPVQLLQMARQLVPIVRFDGYHILADLVGVPDLFARIRPTLARAVPGRRVDGPNPLTRRAQGVVVAWVAIVVPFLLGSLGLLLWNLPGIVTSSVRSLQVQWDVFRDNVTAGRVAAAAVGVVAMVTVAFLPASAAYLTGRIARRSGVRYWRLTEGRPALRGATLVTVVIVAIAALGPQLGRPDGATTDLAGSVVDGDVAELAAGPATGSQLTEPSVAAAAPEPAPISDPAPVLEVEPVMVAISAEPEPAPEVQVEVPATVRPAWPFSFPRPALPGVGGNQAMAVGTVDGATQVALSTSVEWLADQAMRNRNQAYAFAQCVDCRTVAAAFQIVAASGDVETTIPENIAVAVNEICESCTTGAVAVQLAVTMVEQPPAAVKAQVNAIAQRVNGLQGALRTATLNEVIAELEAARAEALALLDPWIVDAADQVGAADAEDDEAEDTPEQSAAQELADGEGATPEGATEDASSEPGTATADGPATADTTTSDTTTSDTTTSDTTTSDSTTSEAATSEAATSDTMTSDTTGEPTTSDEVSTTSDPAVPAEDPATSDPEAGTTEPQPTDGTATTEEPESSASDATATETSTTTAGTTTTEGGTEA